MVHSLAQQVGGGRVIFVNPSVRVADLVMARFGGGRRSLAQQWVCAVPRALSGSAIVWTPLRIFPFTRTISLIAKLESWLISLLIRLLVWFGPYDLVVLGINLSDQDIQRKLRARARRVLFDWSDDFAEFSQRPASRRRFQEATEELIRTADLVLAVNEHLAAKAESTKSQQGRVLTLPNSTNLLPKEGKEHLAESLRKRLGLRRPIIGYAGTMTELRMDFDLIRGIAIARPEWTLVFIGHIEPRAQKEFPVRDNVILLPAVPHLELIDYLYMFDVCILPHMINAHTRGNDPIKLYDYLMAGKPVVSTPVAGVERVRELVEVAEHVDGFIRAIEKCLAEGEPAHSDTRVAVARENSWPQRIAHVVRALDLGSPSMPER